jgi:nucleotide-binding universal stress UspA family protein
MFQRILLAIDDTPSSEMATVFAGALAGRSGATVHVFHVNEYLVTGGGVTLHTRTESTDLITAAVEQLRAAGVWASGSACVASYRQVPHRIVDAATAQQADAIVLGSHRRRRLARLFSFQVRERTTRLSTLPVLTAPSPLDVPRRPDLSLDDLIRSEPDRSLAAPLL